MANYLGLHVKNCPSCGSDRITAESSHIRLRMRCCQCNYRGPLKTDSKEAVAGWNATEIKPMHPVVYDFVLWATFVLLVLSMLYPLIPVVVALFAGLKYLLLLAFWPVLVIIAERMFNYRQNVAKHRRNKWKEGTEK